MGYFKSVDKALESERLSRESSPEFKAPGFKSIEYKLETIVEKICNVENLDENEIKNIIYYQHATILNYDLFLGNQSSRQYALKLFTSKKFLQIFVGVVGNLTLSDDEKICINKLAYDYYLVPDRDPEIMDLLLTATYNINSYLVIKLSAKLGVERARVLAMIANSSFKVEKNVRRVNHFIIKCDTPLGTDDIIYIYLSLFQRFTYLFIYTMLDSGGYSNEFEFEKYKNISTCIYAMLDSMPSYDIKKVLVEYGYILHLLAPNYPVRFRIRSQTVSERILAIINQIDNEYPDLKIP